MNWSRLGLESARIAGLTLAALGVFAVAIIVIGGALAWLRGSEWLDSDNLTAALVCCLISCLFVALFHLRREYFILHTADRVGLLAQCSSILAEMGYEVMRQTADEVETYPSFRAFLFGQGVRITCKDQRVEISGPRHTLDRFRRRLRVATTVSRARQVAAESKPYNDVRLKHAVVTLRCKPELLNAVRDHVIKVLTEEAEVVCQLELYVHGADGVWASTVESRVGSWLKQQGIDHTILKDVIQFTDAGHPPSSPSRDAKQAKCH